MLGRLIGFIPLLWGHLSKYELQEDQCETELDSSLYRVLGPSSDPCEIFHASL